MLLLTLACRISPQPQAPVPFPPHPNILVFFLAIFWVGNYSSSLSSLSEKFSTLPPQPLYFHSLIHFCYSCPFFFSQFLLPKFSPCIMLVVQLNGFHTNHQCILGFWTLSCIWYSKNSHTLFHGMKIQKQHNLFAMFMRDGNSLTPRSLSKFKPSKRKDQECPWMPVRKVFMLTVY
jgi:hypothetical protein